MTNLYNGDSLLTMQDNNVFDPFMGSRDFIGIDHKK